MKSFLKKAGLGLTLVATALTAAAPAEAQRYYGDRYRRDRGADVAVAGLAGLAIGAAIASSNRDRYYDRGYDYRYYGPRYRYYGPRYHHYRSDRYYAPYRGYYGPPRGYYSRGYGGYGGYGYRGYYGY